MVEIAAVTAWASVRTLLVHPRVLVAPARTRTRGARSVSFARRVEDREELLGYAQVGVGSRRVPWTWSKNS